MYCCVLYLGLSLVGLWAELTLTLISRETPESQIHSKYVRSDGQVSSRVNLDELLAT